MTAPPAKKTLFFQGLFLTKLDIKSNAASCFADSSIIFNFIYFTSTLIENS